VSAEAEADADGSGEVSGSADTAASALEDRGERPSDDGRLVATRGCRSKNQGAHDGVSSGDDDDSDFEPESGDESESESESCDESESDIDGDEVLGTAATPATTSQDGVRRLARVRVYNMAYLHPSRAFGPFLPVETETSCHASSCPPAQNLASGAAGGEGEEEAVHAMGSPLTVAPPVPPIPETNFFLRAVADSEASDFDEIDFASFLYDDDDDDDDDDNDDNDSDNDDEAAGAAVDGSSSSSSSGGGGHAASTSSSARRTYMPGDQLRFDWAWIAAARQVIELNLRDLLMGRHHGVLRALLSLEGLRSCSTPGFPPDAVGGDCDRADGLAFMDGEGWDWAGVEGQWRYVERFSAPWM
jgi:hypothetical protein